MAHLTPERNEAHSINDRVDGTCSHLHVIRGGLYMDAAEKEAEKEVVDNRPGAPSALSRVGLFFREKWPEFLVIAIIVPMWFKLFDVSDRISRVEGTMTGLASRAEVADLRSALDSMKGEIPDLRMRFAMSITGRAYPVALVASKPEASTPEASTVTVSVVDLEDKKITTLQVDPEVFKSAGFRVDFGTLGRSLGDFSVPLRQAATAPKEAEQGENVKFPRGLDLDSSKLIAEPATVADRRLALTAFAAKFDLRPIEVSIAAAHADNWSIEEMAAVIEGNKAALYRN